MRRAPLILGAGPAGASAAIVLARAGAAPQVIERQREIPDALCGGFLSWRTLAALERLGIAADRLNPARIGTVRLFAARRMVAAPLPAPALAVSRRRLDTVLADEGITPDRLILFGFSQGTMMSLHVAPRRADPVAGVVGFSGRLLVPEKLAEEALSKPPVLLLHGDQDDIVPPQSLPEAVEALTEAGFETYAHVMKGTAHGIAPDGLSMALAFMRDKLGIVTAE